MEHFKLFEKFLNESSSLNFPIDLTWIVFRYLVKKHEDFHEIIYMSQHEREEIKKEWKGKLPRGFPSSENYITAGKIC